MQHVSAKRHAARCEEKTVTLVVGRAVQGVAIAAGLSQGCPREEIDLCLSFPTEGKVSVSPAKRFELCGLEVLGKSLFSAGKSH